MPGANRPSNFNSHAQAASWRRATSNTLATVWCLSILLWVTDAMVFGVNLAVAQENDVHDWLERSAAFAVGIKSDRAREYHRDLMTAIGYGGPTRLIHQVAKQAKNFDLQTERYQYAAEGMLKAGRFDEARTLLKEILPEIVNTKLVAEPDQRIELLTAARAGLKQTTPVDRLRYASALAEAGILEEAVAQFRTIDPSSTPARSPVDYLVALCEADRIDLFPSDPMKTHRHISDSRLSRAVLKSYCRKNQFDEAMQLVDMHRRERVLGRNPHLALATLAATLVQANRFDDAERVLSVGENHPHLQTVLAIAFYQAGQEERAAPFLKQVRLPEARRIMIVEGLATSGLYEQAEGFFAKLKGTDRQRCHAIIAQRAALRGDRKVYQRSVREVLANLKRKPNPKVLVALAEAYGRANDRRSLTKTVDVILSHYQRFGNAQVEWLHETIRIHFDYRGGSNLKTAFARSNNDWKRSAGNLVVAKHLMELD